MAMQNPEKNSFSDLVARDVKDPDSITKAEADQLGADPQEWFNVLRALKRDIEVQISIRKADLARKSRGIRESDASSAVQHRKIEELVGDLNYWKAGTNRFLSFIEARMNYVKTSFLNETTYTNK